MGGRVLVRRGAGQRWVEVWMRVVDNHELERRRRMKGFTQRDLAALAGVSHQFISQLESGARVACRPDTAKRIEAKLDAPGLLFRAKESPVARSSAAAAPACRRPRATGKTAVTAT